MVKYEDLLKNDDFFSPATNNDIDLAYATRLSNISFKNFKNIKNGKIDFTNSNASNLRNVDGSITGIYGQNGSGKSSAILALELLRDILNNYELDFNKYKHCVMFGEEVSYLSFEINAINKETNSESRYPISEIFIKYDFEIKVDVENNKILIFNESIKSKYICKNGKKVSLHSVVESGNSFDIKEDTLLKTFKKYLVNNCKGLSKLAVQCKEDFSKKQGSIVFNNLAVLYPYTYIKEKLINQYKDINTNYSEEDIRRYLRDKLDGEITNVFIEARFIINLMRSIGYNLYIINTSNIGVTNTKECIPVYLGNKSIYDGFLNASAETINLNLNPESEMTLDIEDFEILKKQIKGLNKIINPIIPGLEIELAVLDDISTNEDKDFGDIRFKYTLFSVRNNKQIPIIAESDGVRRLLSLASLFSIIYNKRNSLVVIDEIDACIFEYLLGEIIGILNESGKGQLIFTSHNLRLLEVLRPKNIYFTTNNENNRFVRITTLCGNNNLRDCYYRNIILGDKDCLYEPTEKYKIESALISTSNLFIED